MPSLSPLNRRVHNLILLSPVRAGSSCCHVNMTTSKQQIANLVSLSWSHPYYLWTDGCPDLIHLCSPQWTSYWVNLVLIVPITGSSQEEITAPITLNSAGIDILYRSIIQRQSFSTDNLMVTDETTSAPFTAPTIEQTGLSLRLRASQFLLLPHLQLQLFLAWNWLSARDHQHQLSI